MNKLAILALALLSAACTQVGNDNTPPGANHTVTVLLSDLHSYSSFDEIYRSMEKEAMAGATKRCATEGGKVVVLRRAQSGVNIMQMTYKCQR